MDNGIVIPLEVLCNVEPGLIAEQLPDSNMCAEDIAREQDFVFHTISNHRLCGMKVRRFFEQQRLAANIQRISILHNQEVAGMKLVHFLKLRHSNLCADNSGVSRPGSQCCKSPGVIGFGMVNHNV
ncbi:hypothetical protein D3C75_856130 [compost metagenome]